jgi:hypothetical protein
VGKCRFFECKRVVPILTTMLWRFNIVNIKWKISLYDR